jgi:cation transport ATPase
LRLGRSVWVWPAAAAVLAAWPVWRSFFPETPDFGVPFGAQVAVAIAELVLCGCWIARYRQRITGFQLPLFAMGFALIVVIMASTHGDPPTADLAALAICWLAAAYLFAGATLLEGQRAFADAYGGAVAPVSLLFRAHERIGYWLIGIALVVATIQETPQGFLLAALAVVSPGAVLVWAALCDTARTVLARRRVHVADLAALPALADRTAVVFGDSGMLVAQRPKVMSILPANDSKPGDIVAIAVALLADDNSDVARGVQEFGVTHRVRVPDLKPLEAGAPGSRRGRLPDRRVAEIGAIDASAVSESEAAPFAEQIARAKEIHRIVLALTEIEPAPRLLGLIILAKVTRPGALEAVRTLRKAGFSLLLANPQVPAQDQDALAGLDLDTAAADSQKAAIGIARPDGAPIESAEVSLRFGGRAPAGGEREADIVIARDDPRTLVDLLQFARDFRRRTRVAIAAANLPGIVLLAAALGYLPASPLLVSGVALAGFVLAIAIPQALRLSPTIANEVDEE